MKWGLVLIGLLIICHVNGYEEDNEFADFEFESEDEIENTEEPVALNTDNIAKNGAKDSKQLPSKSATVEDFNDIEEDDDGIVEDDNEFDHFQDEDEFEGFGTNSDTMDNNEPDIKRGGEPKLTMAKVPIHFMRIDSYWLEMIMVAGLIAYFGNYFIGRNNNGKLASSWLAAHRTFLEDNFALVGDDGKKETDPSQVLGFIKQSDSLYSLWCSGRVCVEGMLVELKFIKRQDLVSVIAGIIRKTQDQVQIKVELSKDIMDNFVLAICSKKSGTKMFKELTDLKQYCVSVGKSDEKFNIPSNFCVYSEIAEAASAIIDSRLVAMLNKYSNIIDSIHISDQFSGSLQEEGQQNLKLPETKRMLIINFIMPKKTEMEEMRPLLQLVIYLIDKLKRFRLSREAKNKSDKNRMRVEEEFLKNTHAARAEIAAQKREDKRKQEKEKILNEDNVDKQKRWEKKEKKREQKKAASKMKQLSIKAL